ncbi:MAG: DUF4153 domain-containing protein [Patescibacteria group bacterium]
MFKKLSSIKNLLLSLWSSCKRFPFAVVSAVIATEMGIALLHSQDILWVNEVLMMSIMGFPLFISAVLFTEERGWVKKAKSIANGVVLLFLALYYIFILPDNVMVASTSLVLRYVFWIVAFYLLVLCVRFLRKQENIINAFWQFNKILFFSLVLTVIYVGALQAGLSIALSSVNYLFELNIDEKRYLEIWIVLVGIFGPLFFLSRVPKKYEDYADGTDYSKELKLFVQFVLVPLVSLYFIILYAYVIKILVFWEWPKGVLAYMILGFSLLGVLTYSALYPLRDKFNWVRRIGQIYYIILIPQIGMLFWSLWWRVLQYGITEKRYIVFIFGCWLLALALYLLISKKKDIRLIPISLVVIAILISFGHWGAFQVSKKSQMNRLEKLLVKNELLVDGQIKPLNEGVEISFDDSKEISATILYLYEAHGLEAVEDVFRKELDYIEEDETKEANNFRPSQIIAERITSEVLKVEYVVSGDQIDRRNNSFNFYTEAKSLMDIKDYDYLFYIGTILPHNIGKIREYEYQYNVDSDKAMFKIRKKGAEIVNYDLTMLINKLAEQYSRWPNANLNPDVMSFSGENDYLSYKFHVTSLSGKVESKEKYQISDLKGWLFFTPK